MLHGQPREFLVGALQAYADGTRSSGMMQPVAQELRGDVIEKLATYYSCLPAPAPNRPRGEKAESAAALATAGDSAAGVPACIGCHGRTALAAYPRLAGQNASYMANRLRRWKSGLPPSSNPEAIMAPIARRLSDAQIGELSNYFASLTPGGESGRSAMKKLLAGLSAALALAGCREGQPVLFAHSLEAEAIARLAWVLFLGGGAILLLVVAAVWTAIRGPSAMRRYLATPRMVIAGGIAFPAVVLTALLFLNVTLMHSAARAPSDKPGIVPITVSGEQWWWRVAYAAPGGAAFESANEIRIPVGRDIVFTLRSADVIHSFWIPSLGGKVDMVPGRDTRLRVHATRPGVFRGPCAEYCGGAHALMALQVTAIQPHEFDAWLSAGGGRCGSGAERIAREGQAAVSRVRLRHLSRGARHAGSGHHRAGPHSSRIAPVDRRGHVADRPRQSFALHRRRTEGQARQPDAGISHLFARAARCARHLSSRV